MIGERIVCEDLKGISIAIPFAAVLGLAPPVRSMHQQGSYVSGVANQMCADNAGPLLSYTSLTTHSSGCFDSDYILSVLIYLHVYK